MQFDELKIWEQRERRKSRIPEPAVLTDENGYVVGITSDIVTLREQLESNDAVDLLKRGTAISSEAVALQLQYNSYLNQRLESDQLIFLRRKRSRIWYKPWTWFRSRR